MIKLFIISTLQRQEIKLFLKFYQILLKKTKDVESVIRKLITLI